MFGAGQRDVESPWFLKPPPGSLSRTRERPCEVDDHDVSFASLAAVDRENFDALGEGTRSCVRSLQEDPIYMLSDQAGLLQIEGDHHDARDTEPRFS